jgi:tetratricopeptide (TPR) repeat protein
MMACLWTGLTLAAPHPKTDVFEQGLHYYEKGDFKGAREAYVSILKEDPLDSNVLLNLAITSAQLQEWGFALAYLRQIEVTAPRTPGLEKAKAFIAANSKLARPKDDTSLVDDFEALIGHQVILPELLLIHWLITFALLYFGARAFRQHQLARFRNEKAPSLGLRLRLLGLTWIMASLFLLMKIFWAFDSHATVTKPGYISLRSGPLSEAAELATIPEGALVVVKSIYKDWAQVRYGQQPAGWVQKQELFINHGSGPSL